MLGLTVMVQARLAHALDPKSLGSAENQSLPCFWLHMLIAAVSWSCDGRHEVEIGTRRLLRSQLTWIDFSNAAHSISQVDNLNMT